MDQLPEISADTGWHSCPCWLCLRAVPPCDASSLGRLWGGERSARMRLLFEANYRRELTKLLQGSGFHLRRKLLCLQKALVSLLGSAVSLLKSHNRKSSPSPLQRNERPPAYKEGEVRLCCFRGNPRRRANLASPPARALIPPRISTLLKNRAIPGILTPSCPFSFFFFSSRAFSKSQRRFPPFYPPEQTGKKRKKRRITHLNLIQMSDVELNCNKKRRRNDGLSQHIGQNGALSEFVLLLRMWLSESQGRLSERGASEQRGGCAPGGTFLCLKLCSV